MARQAEDEPSLAHHQSILNSISLQGVALEESEETPET